MDDETANNANESTEMQNINDQSPLSKQKSVRHKVFRKRSTSTRWKTNISNSVKERRNALNKALSGGTDSLIQIHGYDYYLKSLKAKGDKPDDIITINVSGNRYQTHLSTLETYPNTLLGNKQKRRYYWNNEDKEYFFDRHRACFEAILYYYQSNGRLRRPDYVPLDTFFEEVLFFDLGPEAMLQINKLENVSIIKYIDLPNWHWRRSIWFYLEYPHNSILARILHFISMILTVLSCISLAIETLPEYYEKWNHLCTDEDNVTLSTDDNSSCSSIFSSPFFVIQAICVSYFTIEFILRLISTPSYYRFVLSLFNWIDFSSIVPYFVLLAFQLIQKERDLNESSFISLRIFLILRFLRVFKIYLLFKKFKSLRVLGSTLKESFSDFIIMILILTLMGFLFGAATFFAEQGTNGNVFDSIPKATYWGILTITTVGYGDMYPITVIGQILACSCAFFGVAISAMLVSVLVDRYQRVYNRKRFFPEQIMSAIDSSDIDHDDKQDFINRRLSGIKKTVSGGLILPSTSAPLLYPIKTIRKYSGLNSSSSSYIRFIITLIDDNTNNKLIHQTANELMKELTETIQNTGDRVHLKLISPEIDSPNDRVLTTNQLPSILEEHIF